MWYNRVEPWRKYKLINQTQKNYYMIPFMWGTQNGEIIETESRT